MRARDGIRVSLHQAFFCAVLAPITLGRGWDGEAEVGDRRAAAPPCPQPPATKAGANQSTELNGTQLRDHVRVSDSEGNREKERKGDGNETKG